MTSVASKAVFLSYASQDAEAARRICEALRATGVEVLFDQSELRGGEQNRNSRTDPVGQPSTERTRQRLHALGSNPPPADRQGVHLNTVRGISNGYC
jgi:hypothetical protein